MLSYQHVYHAGNNADCHKHSLQAWLLDFLRKDKTPFLYVDTHAGRGLYHFSSEEIQKLKEYETGIQKLWEVPKWPREAAAYKNVVESLNRSSSTIEHYPGSPWVAESLRRPADYMNLYEMHPREYDALQNNMARMGNLSINFKNGWSIMDIPPTLPRGLIAIDPSYELKEEYSFMAQRITEIMKTYPGFIISLWYPILDAERHTGMTADLEKIEAPFHKSEIMFETDKGMTGSGLFVFNPPANYAATEKIITDWLRGLL
jgi:23S rRNA (adenine2030-N6)-methyltransferase